MNQIGYTEAQLICTEPNYNHCIVSLVSGHTANSEPCGHWTAYKHNTLVAISFLRKSHLQYVKYRFHNDATDRKSGQQPMSQMKIGH